MKHASLLVLLAPLLAATAGAAELQLLTKGRPAAACTGAESAPLAFDGKMDTVYNNGPTFPSSLTVDLGATYKVIKTMTFLERSHVWYAYRIEVSADNQAWTPFVDQTKNREPPEDPAFTDMGGATGRYVRLTLVDAPDRDKNPPWHWAVVREFQVYGVTPPAPALADGKKP